MNNKMTIMNCKKSTLTISVIITLFISGCGTSNEVENLYSKIKKLEEIKINIENERNKYIKEIGSLKLSHAKEIELLNNKYHDLEVKYNDVSVRLKLSEENSKKFIDGTKRMLQ